MDKTSWKKKPTSIFSKTDKVNGPGHACYVTDTSGQKWICYVAYLGKTAGGTRYALVEPYSADTNGVVIGEGTTHPADPDKVYTAEFNPLPLWEKTVGFSTVNTVYTEDGVPDVPDVPDTSDAVTSCNNTANTEDVTANIPGTSESASSDDNTEKTEHPVSESSSKRHVIVAAAAAVCIVCAAIFAIVKKRK